MTILTKQTVCDVKSLVKIEIPVGQEGEVPLFDNDNDIAHARKQNLHHQMRWVYLFFAVTLVLFLCSFFLPNGGRHTNLGKSSQRFRCEVGEDGVPHFQEITGVPDKDGTYFPFSVRVFRIWLPNIFEVNNDSIPLTNDDTNDDFLKSDAFFGGRSQIDDDDGDLETSDSDRPNLFREELSFNSHDTEQILTVDFLDFKNGRSGRFIHALSANQTAIVDKTQNRCFVMPLDPDTNIIPDDILNMSSDKDLNTERVRKNMEIITPKMEDISELSPKIQQQCAGMNIYKLEKHNSELFKRDASPVTRYSELAGSKWIDLNIIGVDRLDDVE